MDYTIPLFDLNFDEQEEAAVVETLRSKWISMGPRTVALEARFCELLACRHALAVTNCTMALYFSLLLLGIGEGDEVITTSLTFVATANAIRYVKAIPVFCDITGSSDLNVDPALIEARITPRTKAIVVMHYGGFPCNMERIMEIAGRHGLKVLEDASHAPFSEYNGRKLGTIGDIGCFSFFSNKNISSGEGGMIVTNEPVFYERGKLLRSHGMTSLSYERAKGHSSAYDVVELGFNGRMDDMRAAIALVQLGKLGPDLARRACVRDRYIRNLGENGKLIIPFRDNREFVSNYIFPIVLKDSCSARRDQVREELRVAGIQTSVHYPPVHRFSIYQEFVRALPGTEYVADNEITLPMYAALKENQIDYICSTLERLLA